MAQPSLAAADTPLRMTYEEWLTWPGSATKQSEWVDGEVIVFMPTKTAQALLAYFLARLLGDYVDLFDLGQVIPAPYEMRLSRSAREPDILFVARQHLARITPDRLGGGADLAVEIVSNDSVTRDRRDKFAEYAEAGIPEYWIFDPRPRRRRANFYQLSTDGTYREIPPDAGRLRSTVLPGFWLDPVWLWQDPLPKPGTLLPLITSDRVATPNANPE